jgi:5-methylcytosine-specific restriction endonuclease McrA
MTTVLVSNAWELPLILALDVAGHPVKWIPWQDAVCLYVRDQVLWTAGLAVFVVRGGVNQRSKLRSQLELNSIIAVRGARAQRTADHVPHLTNRELFRRDRHMCLYCGERFPTSELTRDHVIPLAQGGCDSWENVVSACKPCNQFKGCRTPESANTPLLALPYAPSRIEYLILANRRILADQMQFLQAHTPRRHRGRINQPGRLDTMCRG